MRPIQKLSNSCKLFLDHSRYDKPRSQFIKMRYLILIDVIANAMRKIPSRNTREAGQSIRRVTTGSQIRSPRKSVP